MKHLILILALAGLTACGAKKEETDSSIDEVEASVESGITTISGMGDEPSGASFADNRKTATTYAYQLKNLLLPEAWAAACSRASGNPCVSGVKSETYSQCQLPNSGRAMNGQVTLTYSDAACSLSNTGDQIERTYDLTVSGPYGGSLNISSAAHADYRGQSFGGGGRLTKTALGWDLEVLGKRKVLTRRERTLFDVQTRTTQPLQVTGSLSRASRTVTGGSYEVVHNRARFTANYVPTNLQWTSLCCHPVSGSLAVTYSGSVNGSASVTFNGCGTATFIKDGLSRQITLNYCE